MKLLVYEQEKILCNILCNVMKLRGIKNETESRNKEEI